MAEPLRIVLEFARAQDAGDPHAFRFAPQTYLVRGRRGDFASVEVEWTRELLEDLESLRLPSRDPAALARVGELLRRILEPAGWREHEVNLVDAVADGRPVHVTLRSAAAELYALPWELLTLKSTGQSLGAIPQVLLRYEWPATSSARSQGRGQAPGRVVIAWSAAGGAVPAEGHIAALRAAAAASGRSFDPDRDVIAGASYGRIADVLDAASREGPPVEVLHLLCHGAAAGSTFGLVLDGEEADDGPVIVDPGRAQQLLAERAGMVRLVVIAACDSGNAGSLGNRLGSVAQMLSRAGIAAVVASRFPLSIPGSTRMSEALYRGLLGGATLESAFISARSALARDPTTLDWASAQLYARADDGDATTPLTLRSGEAAAHAPGERAPALLPPTATPSAGGRIGLWIGAAAAAFAAVIAVALAATREETPTPTPARASEGPETKVLQETGPEGQVPQDLSKETTSSSTSTSTTTTTTGEPPSAESGPAAAEGTSGEAPAIAAASSGGGRTSAGATGGSVVVKKKAPPSTSESGGAAQDPSQACERGLRDYLQSRLKAPEGGGVFRVRVKVSGDGEATLGSCDGCPSALSGAARSALGERVDAATARSKGKEKVPCTATFDWE